MSKGMEKTNEELKEEEGLCPSMYSFHSSPEEKNKLLRCLTQYGLETTVDRDAKKDRIRRWIENSVIVEEGEEEGEVGEEEEDEPRVSLRTQQEEKRNKSRRRSGRRRHLVEEKTYKPPVDPRKPLTEQTGVEVKKIVNVLPFKNVSVGKGASVTSSDSAFSSDSSTVKPVTTNMKGDASWRGKSGHFHLYVNHNK